MGWLKEWCGLGEMYTHREEMGCGNKVIGGGDFK